MDLVFIVPGALQLRSLFYPMEPQLTQCTPSYFGAPPREHLTVVFAYLDKAWDLRDECDPDSFDEMMQLHLSILVSVQRPHAMSHISSWRIECMFTWGWGPLGIDCYKPRR
jgi:hypothetical protein